MKISWHDVAEDVEKHAHKLAEDIFALEPDVTEEVDLKALFERILGKEDWTDKLAAQLGRVTCATSSAPTWTLRADTRTSSKQSGSPSTSASGASKKPASTLATGVELSGRTRGQYTPSTVPASS